MKKDRRQFLKTSAATGAALGFPSLTFSKSPNGKLQHAAIGTDGQGWSDLANIASHEKVEVVALCDVDTARMGKARKQFPEARIYQDWRVMLEKEGDKVDSVTVAVPDHMHAPISMGAIAHGKHVYCEKPLTHEVAEARALRLAAKKAGVVTQMGNQIQSAIEYQLAVRMLRDGIVGKIKEIHAWSGARFPQRGRPAGEDPIPKNLDWDLWLGVAPHRPFKSGAYHAFNWRAWQHFGGGAIGDFGCHILDTPYKAVELTAPLSIKAEVPSEWAHQTAWNSEHWPDWEIFHYVYPGTKFTAGDTLPVTWYDGEKQPPRELFDFESDERKIPGGGSLFIGEGGKFVVPHISAPRLLPYKLNKGVKRPEVKGFSHYHAFVDACFGNGETGANFDFAGRMTEAVLLGNVANRLAGRTLYWDEPSMRVTNIPEANQYITRRYRDGWGSIPDVI